MMLRMLRSEHTIPEVFGSEATGTGSARQNLWKIGFFVGLAFLVVAIYFAWHAWYFFSCG